MITFDCGCQVSDDYDFFTRVAKNVVRCSNHEEQFQEGMAELKYRRDAWKALAEGTKELLPRIAKDLMEKQDKDLVDLLMRSDKQ